MADPDVDVRAQMMSLANPRETVLVTSRSEVEILGKKVLKDNAFAVDWHVPLSFEPQMFGIAVGKTRLSYSLIKKSGVFVINYIDLKDKDKLLFCGRTTGIHQDKISKAGLTLSEADTIDCCRIEEAYGYIECKVVEEVETGDHVLFIGQVLKAVKLYEGKKIFHVVKDKFASLEDTK